MEPYEGPRSPLTKSERRRQTFEEKLCQQRECDRERRGSESAEERGLRNYNFFISVIDPEN